MKSNKLIENLLDLDGIRYVIEERLGLWVKFDVKEVDLTDDRPHGVKYSLTLHDRTNKRIMGFDNSHAIEYGKKRNVAPIRKYDHWHRNENDEGQPYQYVDAEKLINDFWKEVSKRIQKLQETLK